MDQKWVVLAAMIYSVRFEEEISETLQTMADLHARIDHKRFLEDFKSCHETPDAKGLISGTGVRNLLHLTKHPHSLGGNSLSFVDSYLQWIKKDLPGDQKRERAWNDIFDAVHPEALTTAVRKKGLVRNSARGFSRSRFFETVFEKIVESNEELGIFLAHAFNLTAATTAASHANAAYYVGFRYSTLGDRIVKSFLAILTPGENKLGFFSFVHVIKGDDDHNHLKKITKGLVLNLSPATYFLGRTLRDDSSVVANMEMLAVERDSFLTKGPVAHAVLMASAAVNQPIVSRMVLVRIGDRLSLGKKLNDADVDATEIKETDLLKHVKALLRKFRELGAPSPLREAHLKSDDRRAAELEKLIREGIDNTPRPVISRMLRGKSKRSRAHQSLTGAGAIEVWGKEPRA